jgi:hypothetical protein
MFNPFYDMSFPVGNGEFITFWYKYQIWLSWIISLLLPIGLMGGAIFINKRNVTLWIND